MGKYAEERIRGYILYYTVKCLGEGIIHVHANKDKMTNTSLAKLWVHQDGQSQVAYNNGVSSKDMIAIQKWIKTNLDIIVENWMQNGYGGAFKSK